MFELIRNTTISPSLHTISESSVCAASLKGIAGDIPIDRINGISAKIISFTKIEILNMIKRTRLNPIRLERVFTDYIG